MMDGIEWRIGLDESLRRNRLEDWDKSFFRTGKTFIVFQKGKNIWRFSGLGPQPFYNAAGRITKLHPPLQKNLGDITFYILFLKFFTHETHDPTKNIFGKQTQEKQTRHKEIKLK